MLTICQMGAVTTDAKCALRWRLVKRRDDTGNLPVRWSGHGTAEIGWYTSAWKLAIGSAPWAESSLSLAGISVTFLAHKSTVALTRYKSEARLAPCAADRRQARVSGRSGWQRSGATRDRQPLHSVAHSVTYRA